MDLEMAGKTTETKMTDVSQLEADYQNNFMNNVHRWGRLTMIVGCLLSFAPVIFLYFFCGFKAETSAYAQVTVAVVAYGFSMWLTEPLSYYPILGSAGTYMGYFAGNVGNMRAPVAMAIQSSLKADVNTPKGNLSTIIAIAISVFVNLAILLVIVAAGSSIINFLPKSVLAAFSYTLPSLYASMLTMRIMANPKLAFTYLPATVVIFFICYNVPMLKKYSLAICIVGTIIWAYGLFKAKQSKEATQ